MRSLINLIYKLTVIIIIISVKSFSSYSQDTCKYLVLKLGIYDFTNEATKRFYNIVPSINFDYSFYNKTHLSIKATTGLAFTSIKYNSKRHNLYLVPLNINAVYSFLESDTKIRPFFGTGICLNFKFDKNEFIDNPHYSFTYGYNINSGLDIPLKKKTALSIEVNYIILTPSNYESLDASGLQFMFGYKIYLIK